MPPCNSIAKLLRLSRHNGPTRILARTLVPGCFTRLHRGTAEEPAQQGSATTFKFMSSASLFGVLSHVQLIVVCIVQPEFKEILNTVNGEIVFYGNMVTHGNMERETVQLYGTPFNCPRF